MDSVINLSTFVFALIPIVSYVLMLYFLIPDRFVSIHRSRRYLVSGLMSPFLVFLFYFIFPWWGDPVGSNQFVKYLFYAVIQIGLLEEFSKFCVYQWVTSERISARNDLPVATMFYSLMISLGFALTENLSYVFAFHDLNSQNPYMTTAEMKNSLLWLVGSRSVTATVMHMICGVMIGYFVAKSDKTTIKIKFAGLEYVSKDLRIPDFNHMLSGIGCAALYHGIYDFNLMLPRNNYKFVLMVIIISFGMVISYLMMKSLIEQSRQIRMHKLN